MGILDYANSSKMMCQLQQISPDPRHSHWILVQTIREKQTSPQPTNMNLHRLTEQRKLVIKFEIVTIANSIHLMYYYFSIVNSG